MLYLPTCYFDVFSALALMLINLLFEPGLLLSLFGYYLTFYNLVSYYFNYSIKPSFGSTYGL